MNKQARSRKFTAKQSARLGAYLAAGLGAAATTTSTADAAIVNIDIGPSGFNIGGINAGLSNGYKRIYNFPLAGFYNRLDISRFIYFGPTLGLTGLFAINGGLASPTNFALNDTIDGTSSFMSAPLSDTRLALFMYYGYVSADFGPGSFMGFRTAQGNYGWLEVTWDSKSSEFEILSGAYEDQPNVAILAGQGAGPAAVPEPGTWAAAALLAGGAAFARWRKRRDEAQKEAA